MFQLIFASTAMKTFSGNVTTWQGKMNCSNGTDTSCTAIDHAFNQFQWLPMSVVIGLLVLIHVIGFFGNAIVLIIIMNKRRLQSCTNWLIWNLSLADITVAVFCIPLDIPLILSQKWLYGRFFCSIYYPIGTASLLASVFTLVTLTGTRFWAIRYPFRRQASVCIAKILIVLIWALSFVLVLPLVLILKYDSEQRVCYEEWSSSTRAIYTLFMFLFGYAMPLVIIVIAYGFISYEIVFKKKPNSMEYRDERLLKENKNVIKLSLMITVTFAVCVLPNQLVWLAYEFGNFSMFKYQTDIRLGSHLMLFLNSALNPIIYNIYSSKFRSGFKELFQSLLDCVTRKKRQRRRSDRSVSVRTILFHSSEKVEGSCETVKNCDQE